MVRCMLYESAATVNDQRGKVRQGASRKRQSVHVSLVVVTSGFK